MDDIVKAALRKWPNVPDCYDWLALDARGDWYMRDDRVQHAGPFPQVKGSRINHDKLREFIHRNYEADARGAWYFQNGPQRVYVWLEAAPWVLRIQSNGVDTLAHTGRPLTVDTTWLDEHGRLFVGTAAGLAIVHPLDMLQAADALERRAWPAPTALTHAELVSRWGVQLRPHAGT